MSFYTTLNKDLNSFDLLNYYLTDIMSANEMIIEITFSYDDSTFPLLMPKVKPAFPETYMCTPVKIKDDTFFINGFSPKVS